MKWGGSSNTVGEKLTKIVGNLFGVRGLSILAAITVFALLIGAGSKWTL